MEAPEANQIETMKLSNDAITAMSENEIQTAMLLYSFDFYSNTVGNVIKRTR